MPDVRALTEAWQAARTALDAANEQLHVARAGHETATQCEREAWEAMSRCRDQDEKPAPRLTPQETAEALQRSLIERQKALGEQIAQQSQDIAQQQVRQTYRQQGLVSYIGSTFARSNGLG